MVRRNTGRWVFGLFGLFFSLSVFAQTGPLAEGTWRCFAPDDYEDFPEAVPDDVSARFIRGYCVYQARNLGEENFEQLLNFANRRVKDYIEGELLSPNSIPPTEGKGHRTIEWWFDEPYSNWLLGNYLADNDFLPSISQPTMVTLTATMYSFERGHARDLGLEIGAFYGSQSSEAEEPPDFSGSISGGIFDVITNIGNPFASFLTLGIDASTEKSWAEKFTVSEFVCEVGSFCTYEHTRKHFFKGPTSLEKQDIGIKISGIPRLNPENPQEVQMGGLSLSYSVRTEEEDAPVDIYEPFSHNNLNMNVNELYVLGSETSNIDVRTGRLLGSDNEDAHTQFLILLRVKIDSRGQPNPTSQTFQLQRTRVEYSMDELVRLRLLGDPVLHEVLSSIDLVCYPDYFNPTRQEEICGFHFKEMNAGFLDLWVTFSIDGDLEYEEDETQSWTLGDLYEGKGFYRLPKLDADEPTNYELRVELDGSNAVTRLERTRFPVSGIEFDFGYRPGRSNPVKFDRRLIKTIKNRHYEKD